MSGIFTIPASAPFGETLARGVLERVERQAFALPETIIYLPTQRATRSFGEAFAALCGGATFRGLCIGEAIKRDGRDWMLSVSVRNGQNC